MDINVWQKSVGICICRIDRFCCDRVGDGLGDRKNNWL
jgi:hypothetical protein